MAKRLLLTLALVGLGGGCARLGPLRIGSLGALPTRQPDRVRFVAVGDVGRFDDPARKQLACHSRKACTARGGCDFTVLLGDNLYDAGVAEPADRCRLGAIVNAYPGERRLLVLGNHDYDKLWPSQARADAQLNFIADHAAEGMLGAFQFYDAQAGPVALWALDSNVLVRDDRYATDAAVLGFGAQIRASRAPWRVVLAHHPYRSRGQHGNAGSYRDGGLSLWPGGRFADYLDRLVRGHADLYLAGHEHNLQFYATTDGKPPASLVVGSGAQCTPPPSDPSASRPDFQRYGYGFAIVDASDDSLRVTLHDERGVAFWRSWRTRSEPRWRFELLAPPTPMLRPCSQPMRGCDDGLDNALERRYQACLRELAQP